MRILLFASMIGIWATGAIAHSPLGETTPVNDAIITEVPTEISMNFKGDIRLTRVSITHDDTQTMDVDLSEQTTFTQEFFLPMHDMGAGAYVIEWRGLGADGHVLNGRFCFTVE